MEKQWSLESFGTDGTPVEFVIAQLPYRVGRSKENDLTIPALGLSRFHAVLERDISGQLRLIDENSTNGTLVNGQPIKKHFLKNGDVVELGKYKLKYLAETAQAVDPDYEKTMLLRPGMLKPELSQTKPPVAASSAPSPAVEVQEPAAVLQEAPPPPAPAAPEVIVETLAGRTTPLTVDVVAEVKAYREVDIYSRVSGQLVKQSFKPGQKIREGDLLFSIDPRALPSRRIDKGQPSLNAAALDVGLELGLGNGAHGAHGFGAALQQDDGGDGHDAVLEGEFFVFVYIALGYGDDVGHVGCNFIDHGRNHAAGSAPGGPEVNEHGFWVIQHAVEIGGGDFLDCCHGKLLYTTPAWAGRMFTRFAYTQRRGVGSGDVEVYLSPWRWCVAR